MTELKPCPFCGGKALLGFSKDEHLNERHFVICENVIKCGCLTQYCNSKDKAIEKWNRRAEKDRYIKLPCKVGDIVYYPYEYGNKVLEKTVIKIVIEKEDRWLDVGVSFLPFENIGKTVFLTKEEAEQKLKELK